MKGNEYLAKMLKLYIIRVSDGSFQIGGPGKRINLNEIDGKKLFIDQLNPSKGKNYKLKIVFDETAGNEYQGKKIKFDVDFRLEAKKATDNGVQEEGIVRSFFSGSTGIFQSTQENIIQTGGEIETKGKSSEKEEGEVAGMSTCQGLPFWVWLLGLIVFTFIFWWDRNDKFKKEEEGWVFSVFLLVSTFVFWNIFDYCQEFRWFPWANVIVLLILAIYFNRKKRIREIIRGNF